MPSTAKKGESAAPEAAGRKSAPAGAKRAKLPVLLITRDDALWPEIGPHLSSELVLKQVDSIDELTASTPPGQSAIVLWDARNHTDAAGVFSRLQLHSTCFAVVALDDAAGASSWTNPIALRQIVAHVAVPIGAGLLKAALDNAYEEVNARTALLGGAAAPAHGGGTQDAGTAAAGMPAGPRRLPWMAAAAIVAVLAAFVAAFLMLRHGDRPASAPPAASVAPAPQPAGTPAPGADEKADLLIEKAQQAMLDRRFIEPAEGSALTLYRRALVLDPDNGEAHQGLQRLAEILFARAQSALDERKIDVALQALETARSIDPSDSRLSALDERIVSLRAEFGPAQIVAAINAQNFDRAAQLIDDAARSKSLGNAKLAQLRDEMRRRHEEFDIANFAKLIDARLQQDKLTEPRNDSAAYYLAEARAAGATVAALQPQLQEFHKRLGQAVHAATDQRRFTDADRMLADLRTAGAPAATIAGLQHELSAARNSQAAAAPEQPQYLDLAQARLAQGKLTEPDNDSALYYVNQLRTTDPKNSGLARITGAVQAQILDQARGSLDTNQPARAEALLQMAAGLGASADWTALNQRLAQVKQAAATPEVAEASLTRVKGVEVEYPADARRKNVEGWVDLAYLVTTDGKVANVKVLNSNPAGVFDSYATHALSRVRYKPMMQDGKAIAVTTKLRVAFRMAK
ncbi:MAG TPA: energy transducer TonB [Steroidobacteraceae bacterium]|nr:energy transducer TonB [Steroidobacteraceae bacterium]